METYLEALDLWEVVEENYKVPPLPNNLTMTQIKSQRREKTRNHKQRHACLLLFQQQSHKD